MRSLERAAGVTSYQAARARGVTPPAQAAASEAPDSEIRTLRETARALGGRLYLFFKVGEKFKPLRVARPMLSLRETAGIELASEAARLRGRSISTQSDQETKADGVRLSTLAEAAESFGGSLLVLWRPGRRSRAARP
jgi:Holliday junction resolvase